MLKASGAVLLHIESCFPKPSQGGRRNPCVPTLRRGPLHTRFMEYSYMCSCSPEGEDAPDWFWIDNVLPAGPEVENVFVRVRLLDGEDDFWDYPHLASDFEYGSSSYEDSDSDSDSDSDEEDDQDETRFPEYQQVSLGDMRDDIMEELAGLLFEAKLMLEALTRLEAAPPEIGDVVRGMMRSIPRGIFDLHVEQYEGMLRIHNSRRAMDKEAVLHHGYSELEYMVNVGLKNSWSRYARIVAGIEGGLGTFTRNQATPQAVIERISGLSLD
ncbi:hypothetical protein QBC43DRAFT_283453 [Cladorrhinum sp. PSN259]|nr:hypothetical protein QBC43DRAFT_283453 [Cladorrhinum sp. PSN259]